MLPTTEEAKSASPPPVLTLYRDTNGWCPFCERVWLALEIKGLPYTETLVNLQNKPQWYKDMVPTKLVPAVLFYGTTGESSTDADDDTNTNNKNERTLVWESADILRALDERFPDTVPLVLEDDEEYRIAQAAVNRVTTAGILFQYGSRNATLTEEDRAERRRDFVRALDELDACLGRNDDSPFFGNRVTAVDCQLVPVVERWRYQLPLTSTHDDAKDILAGRPNLRRWWEEGMNRLPAYANRVAGDAYSWTAVTSVFLKIFSSGSDGVVSDEVRAQIERADQAADEMMQDMLLSATATSHSSDDAKTQRAARLAAATKLISNHVAIVKDCTNADPKSQKDLARASDVDHADEALRTVAHRLLSSSSSEPPPQPRREEKNHHQEAASLALRTVARRLCVPRDMGASSAKVLRETLLQVANEITNY